MLIWDRYRPAIAALAMATLQMAIWVLVVAMSGKNPMPAMLYGDEAARINAGIWAAIQAGLSSLTVIGCLRHSRLMVMIGTGGLGLLFVILAAAGFSAIPQGTVVAAMSSGAAPLCFVAAWIAWRRSNGVG